MEPFLPGSESAACAEMIRNARSVVVLSGAGLSTAAGIPDFRGPQGLYVTRRYDPEIIFNIEHFCRDPLPFYEFTRDFMDLLKDICPTFTHRALACLEEHGLIDGVITQNIDALHHLAGSRRVVELHGSYWSASCTDCPEGDIAETSYAWWCKAVRRGQTSPVVCCEVCGGVIKPDVVFFGEAVKGYDEAVDMVSGCDLLLVLGSSLAVYPAALLPKMATGTVVVVNRGSVALAPGPNRHFVDMELNEFFSAVVEELGIEVA